MCLGIPAKIIRIEGNYASADINGTMIRIGIQLVDSIQPGDYVLVHTGYALEKLNEEEAIETLKMITELNSENTEM